VHHSPQQHSLLTHNRTIRHNSTAYSRTIAHHSPQQHSLLTLNVTIRFINSSTRSKETKPFSI
jgi:hypothetical protein